MDVGDIIAVYAALVSTGTGLIAWYGWRRAPESQIEFRQIEIASDNDALEIAAVAANRSPHEVVIVEAKACWRPTGRRLVSRDVAADGTVREVFESTTRSLWGPHTFESRDGRVPEIAVNAGTMTVWWTEGEVSLLAPDAAASVRIPPGQGQRLKGRLAKSPGAGIGDLRAIRLEARTNDGRTFVEDVALNAGESGVGMVRALKP